MLYGLIGVLLPGLGHQVGVPPPAFPGNAGVAFILLGTAMTALGLWAAPRLLRAYGVLAHSMLAPTSRAELALRARPLAETRSETIDTGTAEIRRIERDLHDGAQARLVAMGMTLSAADDLLDENPAAVRALLLEARDSLRETLSVASRKVGQAVGREAV